MRPALIAPSDVIMRAKREIPEKAHQAPESIRNPGYGGPARDQGRASVADAGPTLIPRWARATRLPGYDRIIQSSLEGRDDESPCETSMWVSRWIRLLDPEGFQCPDALSGSGMGLFVCCDPILSKYIGPALLRRYQSGGNVSFQWEKRLYVGLCKMGLLVVLWVIDLIEKGSNVHTIEWQERISQYFTASTYKTSAKILHVKPQ